MLHAVAEDFARIPGITVATLTSADEQTFRRAAASADYTLVIAPEFGDILFTRCRWVADCGGRLLGPSADVVRLAGDKVALAEHWLAHGVPTPPCQLLLPGEPLPSILPPVVCKPRHGAGAQATFLLQREADLAAALDVARQEGQTGDLLLQPYMPGQPASVAWLLGPRQQLPLMPARQVLSDDGRFHYLGGRLPLDAHWIERAVALSRRAVACVPGLFGYVGVDLVLGSAADGTEDQAIELNPRLTTSYVGLRALARSNLATLMLQVVRGETVHPPTWHPGTVQFSPAGLISTPLSPCLGGEGWGEG